MKKAGKMLEIFTDGLIHAPYQEVIFTEEAKKLFDTNKTNSSENKKWRVSASLLSYVNNDVNLIPLDRFANQVLLIMKKTLNKYKNERVEDYLKKRLDEKFKSLA